MTGQVSVYKLCVGFPLSVASVKAIRSRQLRAFFIKQTDDWFIYCLIGRGAGFDIVTDELINQEHVTIESVTGF